MSKQNKDKSIFIKCECQAEGLGVDYFADDSHYYFSYWKQGLSNKKLSWRAKIRYCWQVLRRGKAFEDEIILSSESANKLCNWIIGTEANKLLDKNGNVG